jgi:hypothetical protein
VGPAALAVSRASSGDDLGKPVHDAVRPDRAAVRAELLESSDSFDLAQRTGFDVESLIFCFGIGGVGAVVVNVLTRRVPVPVPVSERHDPRHRFHRWALLAPFVVFGLLMPLGWNRIYPAIIAMLVGASGSTCCAGRISPGRRFWGAGCSWSTTRRSWRVSR